MSESKVQILRTEFQGSEKRLTDRFDQTEKHVDEKFKQMLDQLKEMKSLSKGTDELLEAFFMWAIGITATGFWAFWLSSLQLL